MKLVQLLAKELKEWPEGAAYAVQDGDSRKTIKFAGHGSTVGFELLGTPSVWQSRHWMFGSGKDFDVYELSSDYKTSMVTRTQWQAEREKMNKPKWIRHRGGKCPVDDGTNMEYRLRDGSTINGCHPQFANWGHYGADADIMAYRVIEETKDQEIEEVIPKHMAFGYASKEEMVAQIGEECPFAQVASTAEKTNFGTITYKLEIDATEATQQIDSLVAKWGQIESPLKWRDEIIELEAYEEEFRREREKLILKLESEGFKLIDHMAPVYGEQIIDMSDWRNWKTGDIVLISNDPDIKDGEYKITRTEEYDYDGDLPIQTGDGWADFSEATVKFIRRP